MRLAADDVDLELLEIAEHGEDEPFVPGIAFGLEGVAGVQNLGRLLGFADKAVLAVGAEEIIGALLAAADLRPALDFNLAMLGDESGFILDIPAERAEERVKEVHAQARFAVAWAFVQREVAAEQFDQPVEFGAEGVERRRRKGRAVGRRANDRSPQRASVDKTHTHQLQNARL
jgi:hypothetical protein